MTDIQAWLERAKLATFFANPSEADLTPLNALQAVLDLHKPENPKKWVPVRCNQCRTLYPCPTVRAITDAIGGPQ